MSEHVLPLPADATDSPPALLTEADALRGELGRLHSELAALQSAYDANEVTRLREANEKLVQAALAAERIAAIAVQEGLKAMARSGEDPSDDEAPPWQVLRDANEALLVAALDERRRADSVEEMRVRQVRYLAMVAHESRNPLSPIRTAATLITRAGDDTTMLQRIQGVIARQVGSMARLVEDLLDGARVANAHFRIEFGNVDLVAVLAQAVETCQSTIDAGGQRLDLDVPQGPLLLRGDAGRLAQIFGNLVDNASKYTPPGGDIGLSVAVHGTSACVRVVDNGIGISKAGLERVFDLFVQEEHAVAADGRGLGIGLSVVRGLVEAHGGCIVARSKGVGLGSEFEVTLPLEVNEPGSGEMGVR
jgi:signal transduction histidine kinase